MNEAIEWVGPSIAEIGLLRLADDIAYCDGIDLRRLQLIKQKIQNDKMAVAKGNVVLPRNEGPKVVMFDGKVSSRSGPAKTVMFHRKVDKVEYC